MKNIIFAIIVILFAVPTYSQQQDVFAGIWKYQNNNELFILNIWKTQDGYKGHYKKITVDTNGNQVAVVYDSNKQIGDTGYNWPYVLTAAEDLDQNYIIGGTIDDNTLLSTPNAGGFIEGLFTMKVININCYNPTGNNTCPLQVEWIVKKMPGLQNPAEPDFNIPTNIILTKE